MPSIDFIEKIRLFLTNGRLDDALRELQYWGKELKHDYAINQYSLFNSRYVQAVEAYGQGRIHQAEFDRECREIQYGLQQVLIQIETLPLPQPMKTVREKGRLVHNIPARMAIDVPTRCTVRIAKNDQLLLERFPVTDDTRPEDITLSKAMSVELVDLYGGKVFHIDSSISSRDQMVGEDDFTQWIFVVTPLSEGHFTLLIKISIIEMVDGVERRREVTLDKPVDIITATQEFYNNAVTATWSSTNYTVHLAEKRAKFFLFAGLGGVNPRALIAGFGMAALVACGLYWFFFRAKPEAGIATTLEISAELDAPRILLDNRVLNGWIPNADTSEIQLPPLPAGQYFVVVQGRNGRCSGPITIGPDSRRFSLACRLSSVLRPSTPDSFAVTILTTMQQAKILIDGKALKPLTRSMQDGKYAHQFRLTKTLHVFNVSDPGGRYECPDQEQAITIVQDTVLSFICTLPPEPGYEIRIRVKDPVGSRNMHNIRLLMDEKEMNVIPRRNGSAGIELVATGVKAGDHTFRVTGLDPAYSCNTASANIRSNLTINLECYGPGLIMILTIPRRKGLPDNLITGKKPTILMDGNKQNLNPILNGSELRFILGHVPRGKHTFSVRGLEGTDYQCDDLQIDVQNNYQQAAFKCYLNQIK